MGQGSTGDRRWWDDRSDLPFRFRWLLEITHSGLHPKARLLAHTLAMHMNGTGTGCRASLATLAEESGQDVATVKRWMPSLVKGGWVTRRRGGGLWKDAAGHYQSNPTEYHPQIPTQVARTRATSSSADASHKPEQVAQTGGASGAVEGGKWLAGAPGDSRETPIETAPAAPSDAAAPAAGEEPAKLSDVLGGLSFREYLGARRGAGSKVQSRGGDSRQRPPHPAAK
jgi:hypothetical protein